MKAISEMTASSVENSIKRLGNQYKTQKARVNGSKACHFKHLRIWIVDEQEIMIINEECV